MTHTHRGKVASIHRIAANEVFSETRISIPAYTGPPTAHHDIETSLKARNPAQNLVDPNKVGEDV